MNETEKTLSSRLHSARKYRRLTQEQLAERANIARAMISKYETETSVPTVDTLLSLAKALDTTTDYLLGLTDKIEKPGTRIYITDSMDSLASHQSSNKEAPITESRLNEILKIAFENYEKRNKF